MPDESEHPSEHPSGGPPGQPPGQQPAQQPAPEWRVAQHRIRNDLQTLSALLRLARRRAADQELLDEYPEWLNALAALYDALPLWDTRETVPLTALAAALRGRCHLPANIQVSPGRAVESPADRAALDVATTSVAASLALAATLGTLGLLLFACRNVATGGTVTVEVSGDEAVVRVEVLFRTGKAEPAGWPPLCLSLAAEATDGQFVTGQDGDDTVAVLVLPRT